MATDAIAGEAGTYANEILHVHSDHLGTPRRLRGRRRSMQLLALELSGAAFGEDAPSEVLMGMVRRLCLIAVSGAVLRCREWAALQLLPGL